MFDTRYRVKNRLSSSLCTEEGSPKRNSISISFERLLYLSDHKRKAAVVVS